MQNSKTFLFFLEIKPLMEVEKAEVDDRSFPQEDIDNLVHQNIVEIYEITDKIVLDQIESRIRLICPYFSLEKVYQTVYRFLERPFCWLIILFKSHKDLEKLKEKKLALLHVLDTIKDITRISRFISNFFLDNQIIDTFYTIYRKRLIRLNFDYAPLSYVDTHGNHLRIPGFTGTVPIYYPNSVYSRIMRIVKKVIRKELSLFSNADLNINYIDCADIQYINEPIFFSNIYKIIEQYLEGYIEAVYTFLFKFIHEFDEIITKTRNDYSALRKDPLIRLKTYFEDLKEKYFSYYPTIFFQNFDSFATQNCNLDELGRVHYTQPFRDSREYKSHRNIYEAMRRSLIPYFKLKNELEKSQKLIDSKLLQMNVNDILVIIDSKNQLYFLSNKNITDNIRYLEGYFLTIKDENSDIFKYVFTTEGLIKQTGKALTQLHNSGWNLIHCLKEKEEDFDSSIITFVEQVNNLKAGYWKEIILISGDSDLIKNFKVKYGFLKETTLKIITAPYGNLLDSTIFELEDKENKNLRVYLLKK